MSKLNLMLNGIEKKKWEYKHKILASKNNSIKIQKKKVITTRIKERSISTTNKITVLCICNYIYKTVILFVVEIDLSLVLVVITFFFFFGFLWGYFLKPKFYVCTPTFFFLSH